MFDVPLKFSGRGFDFGAEDEVHPFIASKSKMIGPYPKSARQRPTLSRHDFAHESGANSDLLGELTSGKAASVKALFEQIGEGMAHAATLRP